MIKSDNIFIIELVISDGPLVGLKGIYLCKNGSERSILLLNNHFEKLVNKLLINENMI
jgi:hypothetical protein